MNRIRTLVVVVSLLVTASMLGQAHPQARNASDLKLTQFPGFPTCTTGVAVSGDPRTGPSVIYSKMKSDCTIPWHWHTPTETITVISGTIRFEARGEQPYTVTAGGFAQMPSHHVHQATCISKCTIYVMSDVAFDIHFIDKAGNEISPDDAMKAVKEIAVTPPAK